MGTAETTRLARARAAYDARAWNDAYQLFSECDAQEPLGAEDLERLATAAKLVGEYDRSREALARAHQWSLQRDMPARAARFAFWLWQECMFAGEEAVSNGWYARTRRLLEGCPQDCVEQGYLLIAEGIEQLGDHPEESERIFRRARETATRFDDPELAMMAGHGLGRSLIRLGRVAEGMAVLDEIIISVTTYEVGPMAIGDLYCGVMEACHEVCDAVRAREWTAALSRWCDGQAGLVPYRGPCLVYRTEVMQLHGAWDDALEEARKACEWLSSPSTPEGAANAYYQLGELHRLRGNYAAAEEAYLEAGRLGHLTEPGRALLRMARGQAEQARASLARVLSEVEEAGKRPALLDAAVDLALATGDVANAKEAAAELAVLAERLAALSVRATADRARGAVLLAEGQPRQALPALRRSWSAWQKLEAPFEAARVRVLIGLACREFGDEESAEMEFDAARWVFQQLGANPELERVNGLSLTPSAAAPRGLTVRELQVLRLVASGNTNREIASALVISEHTVARHLQNIFAKLDIGSRTALAAYAFEHGLLAEA